MKVRGGGCAAPRTMLKGDTLPNALPLVEGPSAVRHYRNGGGSEEVRINETTAVQRERLCRE